MFTAAQARRMGKGEKEFEVKPRVLSPRTIPVMKNTGQRRTTLGGELRGRDASFSNRDAIRLSAMAAPNIERPPDGVVQSATGAIR